MPARKKTQTTAPKTENRPKTRSRRKKAGSGFLSNLAALISMTFFGRLFLVAAGLALVIALNLLISQNDFDFFFTLVGIELVAVAAFFWLRFLIKK